MDNNQFLIELQAVFEKQGITKSLSEIQQIARKMPVELTAKLDSASTINEVKKISKIMAAELNQKYDLNLTGNDVVKMFRQMQKEASKAATETSKVSKAVSEIDKAAAVTKLNNYMSKNTKITKEAKSSILDWIHTIEMSDDLTRDDLRNLMSQFTQLDAKMRGMGKIGLSAWDSATQQTGKFTQWASVSGMVMGVANSFRHMADNVRDLSEAQLELSKVSDLSAAGLKKTTEEAYALGKAVAKTGIQTLNAVTEFKRSSFDLEESMKQAENALKMVNVSENIDNASESAKYLISIMKGFKDTSTEFSDKILDAVNEVSNTQAVNFDNLVDGAQNLSAVADQANVSFEQMLGILTGGYEVLGDMSKVSNGLITIFSRLQAIQLDGEEEVETTAKLQESFSNATKGMVNIVDQSTGQLRSAYDIMDDLAKIWDTLDSNTQSALATSAAGIRQKNTFLSVIGNWDAVKKSVESATNSMGSADIENEKYIQSLLGRIAEFSSSFEQLSNTVLDSGMLSFFVDLGTTGVNALDAITKALTPLGTAATIGGGLLGAKGSGLTNLCYTS